MTMTIGIRKFALTAHVTSSVGWLGAVAAFLALAVAGLNSQDAHVVRAAYVSMELIGWLVIVPLSVASLLTGLVQSLGTTWGLFRHYWIVAKLLITIIATIILLVHMQPISHVAAVAADTTLSISDLRGLRIQLVADAGAALLALIVATALSVYKPKGLTPFGQKQQEVSHASATDTLGNTRVGTGSTADTRAPRWVYAFAIVMLALVLLFLMRHLAGGASVDTARIPPSLGKKPGELAKRGTASPPELYSWPGAW